MAKTYLHYRKLEIESPDKKGAMRKYNMIIVPQFVFLYLALYPIVDILLDFGFWLWGPK